MDPQTCLKTTLKNKYQKLNEANSEKLLLPSRLCCQQIKHEYPFDNLNLHEFRYVDRSDLHSWLWFETVPLSEVLSCDCTHKKSKRTVITLGVCGVGKTTTVQRCALEWAEDKGHHNIELMFPFTFWELNLLNKKMNFIQLIQAFYPEVKEMSVSILNQKNVWFVLDGLDEYHLALDFSCPQVRDVSEVTTVDILVVNLIRGHLLPNTHIWITTRYSAATQIPQSFLLKETQIQGFSDEQKEQHIRSIICDKNLANKAIDHVRISRSLNFLSEIPPICTIMANALKNHLKADDGFKINPLNLTQMYSHLFVAANPKFIAKLKKLAVVWIGRGSVMNERDLQKSGISLKEAQAFSKECPLVLREDKGLQNTTVFRFGHQSIKEFLTASEKLDDIQKNADQSRRLQQLVYRELQAPDGESDVVLRFIFGLIKERKMMESTDLLFGYTKRMILDSILGYTAVVLFHCLREFDSQALLSEVKYFQKNNVSPVGDYTPMHWHFMIQRATNFEGKTNDFEMQVSKRCDEELLRHLPHILKSKRAMLRFSNLTDKCCPALASVLSTKESYMRELDLGYNNMSDDGVRKLVEGLTDRNCRLKTLRLQACGVTPHACQYLATALAESQKLLVLDVSKNEIGNDGLKHLANGLRSPKCKIDTLKLSQCNIEEDGCNYLASVVQNSSHLKVLDLSINMFGDKGANKLLENFNVSKLTKLEMYHCGLTELSCETIGKALMDECSTLLELNLSNNNLNDAGFALICKGMRAWCSLERLNVSRCGITDVSCRCLADVLTSVSQLYKGGTRKSDWQAVELKDLDLSMNRLKDKGVKEITAGLKNPYGHLKTLMLNDCCLTDDCCAELAMALASQDSVLSELDLSSNELGDKGVKKLCMGLVNPACNLEKLSLRSCGLTSKSIGFLVTALKSNPQHLAEMHLLGNNLDDSEIKALVELTKNKNYVLNILDVSTEPAGQHTYPLPPYFSSE